jgi:hypothetical protein
LFKQSTRYFVLVLALVALTATVRPAHAQSDDPCNDPANPACVVSGNDPPPPTGKAVSQNPNEPMLADSGSEDDSKSVDDLISYLIILYGLA